MKLINKNNLKKYFAFVVFPIVASSITLLAVACNKNAPNNYSKEYFKPTLIFNETDFKPKEMTVDDALELITLNSDGTSNLVSLTDQKSVGVYKITNIIKNGLHLEIMYEVSLEQYDLKYKYISYHGPYLSQEQKDILETKKANEHSLKTAVELDKKEGHDFFGLKIKPEFENLSADQMKLKGDSLIIFNKDDPNFKFKNIPAYSGINLRLVDIIKAEDFNQNDPVTLIFNLEISKGTGQTKVFQMKSIVIKLNTNNNQKRSIKD